MEIRAGLPALFSPPERGEVRAMSFEQCWALNADRSRCEEPAAPDQCFCEEHDVGYGLHPMDIFCLPEAEMPPDLVLYIRSCCPTWPFPEPSPPIVTLGADAAPSHFRAAAPENDLDAATPRAQDDTLATEAAEEAESLAWLRATLREVIEDVKAGEADPMRKATAVARLGGLFLRTFRVAELQKENRSLRKSLAAVESRLADLEALTAVPTPGSPSAAHSEGADRSALQHPTDRHDPAPPTPPSSQDQHRLPPARESSAAPATTASRASP
jgi:hypothetical protein